MWSMGQQNTGAIAIDRRPLEDRPETLGADRVMVVHTHYLQAVERYLLVVQDADAGTLYRLEILDGVGKLLVIAGDEIGTVRRPKIGPRLGEPVWICSGAIEQVAGNEDHVRPQPLYRCHNTSREATIP